MYISCCRGKSSPEPTDLQASKVDEDNLTLRSKPKDGKTGQIFNLKKIERIRKMEHYVWRTVGNDSFLVFYNHHLYVKTTSFYRWDFDALRHQMYRRRQLPYTYTSTKQLVRTRSAGELSASNTCLKSKDDCFFLPLQSTWQLVRC